MTISCGTCRGSSCCHSRANDGSKPVIAIAGLSCEASTFTKARTELPAFHPLRASGIVDGHAFLRDGTPLGNTADWRGALTAYAIPGGTVTRDAFETLADDIVTRLGRIASESRLDGLWYDIHGAMYVEDLEDCESELLQRIRSAIGCGVAISASLDLHGNVSQALVEQTDLITCYRSAPHEDVDATKERACRNLVNLLRDRRRYERDIAIKAPWPTKAWIPIPILLPGEQTSTRLEPAKSIYAAVHRIADSKGIIDASVWVGYAWADEPRSHASVVVTGWNTRAVIHGAGHLAHLFWASRKDFHFAAPAASFDECFDDAVQSTARPYFISDSGDNPTAGGSGDMIWTFRRLLSLLRRKKTVHFTESTFIYASLPCPDAVAIAVEAGLDAHVTVTIDPGIDDEMSCPMTLTGSVHAIKLGDAYAKVEVVLKLKDLPIYLILTKRRKPYHYEHDFIDLNLDIGDESNRAIVVVKIGYLEPELYALAKDWILALTTGGVDQDLPRLGHERIARPMWPLNKEFEEEPDLSARIIGRSK